MSVCCLLGSNDGAPLSPLGLALSLTLSPIIARENCVVVELLKPQSTIRSQVLNQPVFFKFSIAF